MTPMASYQRAVPVLQVANVEKSLRWCVDETGPAGAPERPADPEFRWSIYLRMVYGLVEFEREE